MIADFISPADIKWSKILHKMPHDFYHLPEYISFAAKHEGGEPVAFVAEDAESAILMPLLIRKIPNYFGISAELYDAITPYGYPSPLLLPPDNPSVFDLFWAAFQKIAKSKNLVSAFFRLHPLMKLPMPSLSRKGLLVNHGKTVTIDLRLSGEELRRQTRENHRRNIRKLHCEGFEAKIDDWRYWNSFIMVYRETMHRLEAKSFYLFSDEYFFDLRSALGKKLHLCAVLAPNGELASACIFTTVNGIVEYHLGGTSSKYISDAPSKLMFESIKCWAKDQGEKFFHLGGGFEGKNDSLFNFKAGFSTMRTEFHTWRVVLNEARYLELEQASKSHQIPKTADGYFPSYRRGLA
jgi:lipid II:glycine glycyltransferase (peptidoglycan interpeptide bridge formation enzyme)